MHKHGLLSRRFGRYAPCALRYELLHGYEQVLKWFIGELNISGLTSDSYKSIYRFPAFVFSLTELNDDMHFWEKYGNKHKGVRIGFSPPELLKFWRKLKLVNVILTPVIYQNYDDKFIGAYAKSFNEFKHNFSKEINKLIAEDKVDSSELQNIAFCSSLTASLIKRKEWKLEKEWRIICIPLGHAHDSIIGDFSTGTPLARLVNQGEEVLDLLTNSHGTASKDIIKVGHLSGNKEFVQYAVELIFKKTTGKNFFTDNISESSIITR